MLKIDTSSIINNVHLSHLVCLPLGCGPDLLQQGVHVVTLPPGGRWRYYPRAPANLRTTLRKLLCPFSRLIKMGFPLDVAGRLCMGIVPLCRRLGWTHRLAGLGWCPASRREGALLVGVKGTSLSCGRRNGCFLREDAELSDM